MASVKLRGLTKTFGKARAVSNLTLEVKDGEFLVLLGPSGCGKTTILRCIAGLETADRGDIYIGEDLVNDVPPKDRDVAMVFQSYALYPHMSVSNNIAFPLKMRKYSGQEIERKVKHVADLLRISDLLTRKPKQLSGGQRQRVALGRAIVREPKVFLMDEPLSNLDAMLRVHMRTELKRLQKELGVTTIYVTHDQVEALTMADRVVILNKGLLQQTGSPNEIYFNPKNLFVAAFVGSPPSNLIDCTIHHKADRSYADTGVFKLVLEEDLAGPLRSRPLSSEAVLGVRPRDISIYRKNDSRKDALRAEVYMVEPLGDENIVDLRAGDIMIKAIDPERRDFAIGEEVKVGLDSKRILLFDKRSGETLL